MASEKPPTQNNPGLQTAARVGWLALFVILLAIHILGIPSRYQELAAVCPSDPCISMTLTAQDVAALESFGFSHTAYAIYQTALEVTLTLLVAFLGLLIFWRLGRDWFGLVVALVLVLFGLTFLSEADSAYLRFHPQFLPIVDYMTLVASVAVVLLLLLFPDGRFVPRWTRWVILALLALAAADRFLVTSDSRTTSDQYGLLFLTGMLAALVVALFSQIYRYRSVSTPSERQQTKWILLGFAGLIVSVIFYSFFVELNPPQPGNARLFFNVFVFAGMFLLLLLFPITLVLSIVRYRLWDIDLVIRKTVIYTILTGSIILIYAGSIIGLQALLGSVTGESSPLVIVISTLLIAALFNPLRSRIQAFIDRRFFRGQVDQQQVLAQFGRAARSETDLDALTAALSRVVQETMQPEQMSLWLRPAARTVDAAKGPKSYG